MKHLFYLLFTFALISCSESNDNKVKTEEKLDYCDCKSLKLDQKYNRFYLNDIKKPYTGKCKIINEKNVVLSERNYIEGKYHGEYINYHENGQVASIKTYKNHFLNGDYKEFTPNGELIAHRIYKQSTLIETIEYHPELAMPQ